MNASNNERRVCQRLFTWLSALSNTIRRWSTCLGGGPDCDTEDDQLPLSVEETEPHPATTFSTVRPWF